MKRTTAIGFVFLLVLATAVLAIVTNRIGTWFRTGVLGLVAGGVTLGLAGRPSMVGMTERSVPMPSSLPPSPMPIPRVP